MDAVLKKRRAEADEFYDAIHPPKASADEKLVQRQALAGLLWTKQSYLFDVNQWLEGDSPTWPPPDSRWDIRNQHWPHLNSLRVMTMPDKWEYPWFAAWDLAFHTVAFALIDPKFAKEQLWVPAVRAVSAPQRPDPRLRMGVFRSESSGSRLGGLARLQHGPPARPARPTACSSNAASTSC